MFKSRYPQARITHVRVLQCKGEPRGLAVIPKPLPPIPPPEIVHRHSCVVPLPTGRRAMIIEWTDAKIESHLVDL